MQALLRGDMPYMTGKLSLCRHCYGVTCHTWQVSCLYAGTVTGWHAIHDRSVVFMQALLRGDMSYMTGQLSLCRHCYRVTCHTWQVSCLYAGTVTGWHAIHDRSVVFMQALLQGDMPYMTGQLSLCRHCYRVTCHTWQVSCLYAGTVTGWHAIHDRSVFIRQSTHPSEWTLTEHLEQFKVWLVDLLTLPSDTCHFNLLFHIYIIVVSLQQSRCAM